MDKPMLVSDLTENGKRIIEQLMQGGFEVTAAMWLKKAEDGLWYFYIISPMGEHENRRSGFGQIHAVIRQMPEPNWIGLFDVKLIGPSEPLAKEVLAIRDRHHGPKASPIRWEGWIHGIVTFDGAYIYPLPAMAAS